MNFIYLVVVSPIETIVDWLFNFILNKFEFCGVIGAVFGVSLAINFLALPLYNVADGLQEKERAIAKSLEYRIRRIKKAFSGDERFLMLRTYYRQNDYHPLYALRSSLSILIEIPFFIAAYHYLSHSELLRGASFWIFRDLGSPDSLVRIGKFSVNILPILMTLINFISGAVYLKNAPSREKLQLYGIALIFLFLLYNSPSGLVIYWILNNIFSLAKNIVMKMKDPGKILHRILSIFLMLFSVFFFLKLGGSFLKKIAFFAFTLLFALFPMIARLCAKKNPAIFSGETKSFGSGKNFLPLLFSGLGLSFLCGLVLPSSVISTNPLEFSFLGGTSSPLSYVASSFFVFFGFFVFWPCAIFKMFGKKVRSVLSFVFPVLFLCALSNAYFFKCNYGDLNIFFELEDSSCLNQGALTKLLSVLALFMFIAAFFLLKKKSLSKIISVFMFSVCLAELSFSFMKISDIRKKFIAYEDLHADTVSDDFSTVFNLSKTQKNVIVIFLDRAINSFAPDIFREFSKIKNQFRGFVYFPNTLSFSTHTAAGGPPLMGGYEYTQEKINSRKGESLREKHNEATLVMPKLFLDGGFDVTVTDPPLPNYYVGKPDEAFSPYPQIKVDFLSGKYYQDYVFEKKIIEGGLPDSLCRKEIVKFSVLQIISPLLRNSFYGNLKIKTLNSAKRFLNLVSSMYYLPKITSFDSEKSSFVFLESDLTHEVFISLSDDYETPAVDNSADIIEKHFQANVSAYKQLGKWFDFLRENDAYDNTRIVIVSDHGYDLNLGAFSSFSDPKIPSSYNALLLFKDFAQNGEVRTDQTFMTTADTLFLAKENLPVSDSNPFTKKKFVQEKEGGVDVYDCIDWNVNYMQNDSALNLDANRAFHVSENIFDEKNWHKLRSAK
ncbi:MAG: YidC/Oxa1 family membrane protein insertase [Treponema sp.]|nr:YidC/Oxa1 family membrane protein insertase [Treponema sp.]